MVKRATCEQLGGHCGHWGLSDTQHALVHVQARLMDEIAAEDIAAGVPLGTGKSTTSLAGDGARMERLLADEGYRIAPLAEVA